MLKKIKDLTIEEVCKYCATQSSCRQCLLREFCKSRKKKPGAVSYSSIIKKVEVNE